MLTKFVLWHMPAGLDYSILQLSVIAGGGPSQAGPQHPPENKEPNMETVSVREFQVHLCGTAALVRLRRELGSGVGQI